MIIRKIKLCNFRCFREITVDFADTDVVLLSAPNGVGKTTVIDAIEWCLTGDIGRLKNAFDTRSTNDAERKLNTSGILKNNAADSNESVKVYLSLIENGNETILCREQSTDELNPNASRLTINGDEEAAREFVHKYVDESFYNFHICDVQKSFNIQSKKRGDLEPIFSEFITNFDEQNQIADNLEVFAKDASLYIKDKESEKISDLRITELKERISGLDEDKNLFNYPATKFYQEERTDIVELNRDSLTEQKAELINCGFLMVEKELSKLIMNDSLKKQKCALKALSFHWTTNSDAIRSATVLGLPENKDLVSSLESSLERLEKLQLSKNTLLEAEETLSTLLKDSSLKAGYSSVKDEINNKEKRLTELLEEVDILSGNNKVLELLSSLSANKQTMIEYRNVLLEEKGTVCCPICGSETFATMEKAMILKEADDYLKRNGEYLKTKQAEITQLNNEIDLLYQKIINQIKETVETEKGSLKLQIREIRDLERLLQPYFDAAKEIQAYRDDITVEELNEEKVKELLMLVEQQILNEDEERESEKILHEVLEILGYIEDNETFQQTYAKVRNLVKKRYEVSNFTCNLLVSKIKAIDSKLRNLSLSEYHHELERSIIHNQKIDKEIQSLQILQDSASERAKAIRALVCELSNDEYKKIGPILGKYYKKLIRLSSDDDFVISHKNGGISLTDDKDKNIVNVLSSGQISVFMLALFFAGINARNKQEKFKVFFVDDLTACMDDVNMLAFMDLLKYQMTTKACMEQLFFVTCDNRISKLLKYKMKGRNINLIELDEESFYCNYVNQNNAD